MNAMNPTRHATKVVDTITFAAAKEGRALKSSNALECGCHSERRWYVAMTSAQQENLARDEVNATGFASAFLPRETVELVRPGRPPSIIIRPLFAGYLFVQFAPSDPWGGLYRKRGIKRNLGKLAGRPSPISTGFVEKLISSSDARLVIAKPVPTLLDAGAEVDIVDGLLHGSRASVVSHAERRPTAVVRIDGFSFDITISVSYLREVKAVCPVFAL